MAAMDTPPATSAAVESVDPPVPHDLAIMYLAIPETQYATSEDVIRNLVVFKQSLLSEQEWFQTAEAAMLQTQRRTDRALGRTVSSAEHYKSGSAPASIYVCCASWPASRVLEAALAGDVVPLPEGPGMAASAWRVQFPLCIAPEQAEMAKQKCELARQTKYNVKLTVEKRAIVSEVDENFAAVCVNVKRKADEQTSAETAIRERKAAKAALACEISKLDAALKTKIN